MLLPLSITVRLLWNGYRFKFHDDSCAINMPIPETDKNLTPVKALNLGVVRVQGLFGWRGKGDDRSTKAVNVC